jgi:hypothetical protein
MDVDGWWHRLGSAALVGTARRPAPSPAEMETGAGFVLPRAGARPEEAALDAAALGAAMRRAGRLPSTGAVPIPAAAPPERLAEAPARAAQLLELLLTQPPTDVAGTEVLLLHWSTTCRAAGCRVPHRLLPALLDRASSKDLRARVSVVVGERGAWLAGQNPAWAWIDEARSLQAAIDGIDEELGPAARRVETPTTPALDSPEQWALEGTDVRVSQLRKARRADPDAARGLLLTTWSSDSAKDRRALLETLLVNLGPHDEELLEGALDDRAASVRDLAAQLLDALPASRRAARMADRLRPLIGETGRLRRHLEVRLPDDPDASARRDGLGKPPAGRSARGWWLERIVAGSPFDAWDRPAAKVVPLIRDQDVLAGLRRAAEVRRDRDWARALLDLGSTPELLGVLPPMEREARVVDELGHTPTARMPALLRQPALPWSPRLSAAVVARLTRLTPEEAGLVLEALMPRLVRGLDQEAVPALQRWRVETRLPRRHDDQLGSLIQSRTLRHTISEAFQT